MHSQPRDGLTGIGDDNHWGQLVVALPKINDGFGKIGISGQYPGSHKYNVETLQFCKLHPMRPPQPKLKARSANNKHTNKCKKHKKPETHKTHNAKAREPMIIIISLAVVHSQKYFAL